MTGGGSDGNFTAALGVPTLDGLGIDGGGAHTLAEYALISSIASWVPARMTTGTPPARARAVIATATLSSSSLPTATTARLFSTPSLCMVRRTLPSPISTGMSVARVSAPMTTTDMLVILACGPLGWRSAGRMRHSEEETGIPV